MVVVFTGTSAALALVVAHGAVMHFEDRRRARHIQAERALLVRALAEDEADERRLRRLRRIPADDRIRLFTAVGRVVTGREKERLTTLARHVGILDLGARRARARRWWRRLEGARLFVAVGGGAEIMPGLLHDPDPFVRGEAVRWLAARGEGDDLARILRLGAHPTLLDRSGVVDALARAGPAAIPVLAEHLATATEGLAAALDAALARPDPSYLPALDRLVGHEDADVRGRVARLAGELGGGAAVRILGPLVADPEAAVRAEAARAFGGLGHLTGVAVTAPLLDDPDAGVRHAAALALRAAGSVGLVLLRRRAHAAPGPGRDIADQVLGLPDTVDVAWGLTR